MIRDTFWKKKFIFVPKNEFVCDVYYISRCAIWVLELKTSPREWNL